MQEKYYLGAYWKNRKQTLLEYLTSSRLFLRRIKSFNSIFSELAVYSDGGKIMWLDNELRNLDELILKYSIDSESKYENADCLGNPTWSSFAPGGFDMQYSNTKPIDKNNVSISVRTAKYSPWLVNAVVVDLPGSDPTFKLTYNNVYQLLKVVIECWQPQFALITSSEFRDILKNDKFTIGWVTYFRDMTIIENIPGNVEKEYFNDGLLVSTVTDPLDTGNPEHLETGKQIRDALQPLGRLRFR